MERIDAYIEKVYKNIDSKDEETENLKEEMREHLYDKVTDLINVGHSKDESIDMAISGFGDENDFLNEIKSIIVKQTKYTNILLKLSVLIFIIGFLSKIGGWYSEKLYIDKWDKTRPVTSSDIKNEIRFILSTKNHLQQSDKENIDAMLNGYNDKYNNGLYSIRILKDNVLNYEYSRSISSELTTNSGGGASNLGNGWVIENQHTDLDSYRDSEVWNQKFNLKNVSNSVHFQLKNIGFWLISLSWVLMIMYFTQKSILKDELSRNKVILISVQTIIIFASFTSDKDIIIPIVAFFLCHQLLYVYQESKLSFIAIKEI
jgi:hypothetical protein